MAENNILLRAEGICKQFNGIPVLKNVDLEIRRGEVHSLMGENGAGKSTIIKILTGVYTKDEGQIYIEDQPVEIRSRQDSAKNGISVIYQELSLVPDLTVEENILLGKEEHTLGFTKNKSMRKRVKELIEYYDFELAPQMVVETLGMAQRQMVEILKALSVRSKLIIMDEPTASLSAAESEKLFKTIDRLRSKGVSVLYISHRLDEVYRLSDRLTVMRNGENVGVLNREEISPQKVIPMMLGRETNRAVKKGSINKREDIVLSVRGLAYGDGLLKDVNFDAYGGEILGIGGLVGSGRTELVSCIYGILKPEKGTITLNGEPVSRSVKKNIEGGFAFVPEDRRGAGFIPKLSIEKNLVLPSYDILAPGGIVSKSKEVEWAKQAIEKYDIRPAVASLPVQNLSGGNQQKVVIGRGLARKPKVLILDEPTAGIDVGVKAELYEIIRKLSDDGTIVILVSSDMAELCALSDRVLVMHNGRFFEELPGEHVTQNDILMAASGVHTEGGHAL